MILAHPVHVEVGVERFFELEGVGVRIVVSRRVETVHRSRVGAYVVVGDGRVVEPKTVRAFVCREFCNSRLMVIDINCRR